MTGTLFPEVVFPKAQPAEKPEKLSADRRRTKRQKDSIAQGIHPVTRLTLIGTQDATCGTCVLRVHFGKYSKCTYLAPEGQPHAGPYVTNSAATDLRAWWPGCARWQAKETS